MKWIQWKLVANYEKEEQWLNEMAAKGLALQSYFWMRYVFEDCAPGEYTYRIELLPQTPGHIESQNYIRFMEENGVELVATYFRWAYFRRKSSEGAFDLFSDRKGRLRHYRLVRNLWLALLLLNTYAAALNLGVSITTLLGGMAPFTVNFVMGCISTGVSILLLIRVICYSVKIGRLKREGNLME